MPTNVTFRIQGIAPYSQSKPILEEHKPGESDDDFGRRTWRNHMHVDRNGMVFIPNSAIKNCIAESAKFMDIKIPGKGRQTFTKHVEAGVMCLLPVSLGIRADAVEDEVLFLSPTGKRGAGGTRVWKHYPIIREWKGDAELIVLDETVLQTSERTGRSVLEDIVEGAGQYIGLGRFRPRNNGYYGRFAIENFKVHR